MYVIPHIVQECFFWFGLHKTYQTAVEVAPSTKSCLLVELIKGCGTESIVFQVINFYSSSWTTSHIVNCFELFLALHLLAFTEPRNLLRLQRWGWCLREGRIGLDAKKDVYFASYISLDILLATCALSSFEELCDDHEFGRSSDK